MNTWAPSPLSPPLQRKKCFVIFGAMFSSLPPDLDATASQLLKVIALATWSFRAGKPCWLFLGIGLNNLTREAASHWLCCTGGLRGKVGVRAALGLSLCILSDRLSIQLKSGNSSVQDRPSGKQTRRACSLTGPQEESHWVILRRVAGARQELPELGALPRETPGQGEESGQRRNAIFFISPQDEAYRRQWTRSLGI